MYLIFSYGDCETRNTSLAWFYGEIFNFNVNWVNFDQEQCTVTLIHCKRQWIKRKLWIKRHSKNRFAPKRSWHCRFCSAPATREWSNLLTWVPEKKYALNTPCLRVQCETTVRFWNRVRKSVCLQYIWLASIMWSPHWTRELIFYLLTTHPLIVQ